MNTPIHQLLIPALSVALFAAPVLAHDPNEHAEAPGKPDCAAMNTMDHSKMDMNDPVVQAMQEKCKAMTGHGDQDGQSMEGMENMESMDDDHSADSEEHEQHQE